MQILIPALVLGVLGLIFGTGLAIASKFFVIKEDSRLEKVHGLLPGSNCGVCGGAGCLGFAQELLSGKKDINACKVSSKEAREEIISVLKRNK